MPDSITRIMDTDATLLTTIIGGGVLLSHLVLLGILLGAIVARGDTRRALQGVSSRGALWAGFAIALAATVGSLYYSEIVGMPVCDLCWFQRIAIYPQVILFGVALWKHDTTVVRYVVPLAGAGLVFAVDHYILQMSGVDTLGSCGVTADTSCAAVYMGSFGYITFSMLGITVLVLLAGCAWLARWTDRSKGMFSKGLL